MRLTDRVWAVGGGGLGYGISSFYDCNVYALDTGADILVFDAGSGIEPELQFRRFEEAGLGRGRSVKLLLTHAHADHGGGASEWRARFGAEVFAGEETAAMVVSGDEVRTSLADARASGTYPAWYRLAPCPVDRIVRHGDELRSGELTLRVIAAPGHSSDMVCYYCSELKALFAGDAIFQGGKLAILRTPDFSMEACRDTIKALAALEVEQLYAGHGAALITGGGEAIAAAHARFQAGLSPLSIV